MIFDGGRYLTHYFSTHVPILKALSDETRLQIVQMLTCEKMCANELLACFCITQPSLSYHMKILTSCGLVRAEREAGFTRYYINKDTLERMRDLFDTLLTGNDIL